jgi:HAE1 family hydrophobic/amphiphilic exporter-1
MNPVRDPADLENLFLETSTGEMVPMSTVVTLEERAIAPELDRESQMRAIRINASLADGFPIGEALGEAEALAEPLLPPGSQLVPLAEAATLEETSRGLAITFGFAILVVFLVLAAQFEGFVSAFIVMRRCRSGSAARWWRWS